MHHRTQPPTTRTPIPAAVAIPAMLITVLLIATLAIGITVSQPAPILIELAPQNFAATDGDRFIPGGHPTQITPTGLSAHRVGTTT